MSKKILIVDDDKELLDTLAAFLKEQGYWTMKASTGGEALKILKEEEFKPDLTLLDIRMPDMSGIDVLQQIVRDYPNVVVAMLTAVHEVEVAKKAIDLGACDYLTKPITPTQLLNDFVKKILD